MDVISRFKLSKGYGGACAALFTIVDPDTGEILDEFVRDCSYMSEGAAVKESVARGVREVQKKYDGTVWLEVERADLLREVWSEWY
ncbi:hypothetical protein [Paenibacillus caui]|uniref:hypothetical protein n=1 Tax=Paenibacillus caui TaxID=2873927 RepID=UPI001CA8E7F3|nr:hypothetical protein [Paenibacillus caui]